jgi:hypothetical protein
MGPRQVFPSEYALNRRFERGSITRRGERPEAPALGVGIPSEHIEIILG